MSLILKAGEPAPADGLYRVTHYQHRLPHLVSVVSGTCMPPCNKCGDHVHFELVGPANRDDGITSDLDFKNNDDD